MHTSLYPLHCDLGAKMTEFCGWEMPLSYTTIQEEHRAVRERAGLFDVSHMGRIAIKGAGAECFLDYLATNRIRGKRDGTATYSLLCKEEGGCLDDLLIFRLAADDLFLIANAANREKDWRHLTRYCSDFEVTLFPVYEKEGILALQGPSSAAILAPLIPGVEAMHPMRVAPFTYEGKELLVATTGYTGERGFELFAPNTLIPILWRRILDIGRERGITPAGLGARDTLRLEMGFALYGHELTEELFPTETVAAWAVKLDKERFLGKEAISALEKSSQRRHPCAFFVARGGIPRGGEPVTGDGVRIGTVTSGGFSPTLQRTIALGLLDRLPGEGEELAIAVRGRPLRAEITHLPFVKK